MSDLADLHDELRAVARDVLATDVDPGERWQQAVNAGWTGLEVPEALDGSGATFAETAVVLEELGRAVATVPYLGVVLAVAAGAGYDDLLRSIAGGATAAVALAPHADAAQPVPPFRLDAAGRLSGRAELVVDAASADHLLVLAATAAGDLALVHLDEADVEGEPVVDASRSLGTVEADGLAVPAGAVRPIGPADAEAVLDRAAVAVAADAYGAASAMLDATVAYVGVRHQFDRPIGSFQAVKHLCADALVALRLGRELLDEAVAAVAAGDPDAGLATSRVAAHLGDAAVSVVGTAMQLHGGIGYTWESGIHRSLKRVLLDRSLFGSPAEHRRRIADRRWPETK